MRYGQSGDQFDHLRLLLWFNSLVMPQSHVPLPFAIVRKEGMPITSCSGESPIRFKILRKTWQLLYVSLTEVTRALQQRGVAYEANHANRWQISRSHIREGVVIDSMQGEMYSPHGEIKVVFQLLSGGDLNFRELKLCLIKLTLTGLQSQICDGTAWTLFKLTSLTNLLLPSPSPKG